MTKINRISFIILVWVGCASLLATLAGPAAAQQDASQVLVLTYDGPLTPAMVEYLERGLRTADQRGADLLIFQLSTPGGGITLMNHVVQVIRASDIPVVVYIWPRGGMAGSAGLMVTIAGHASAMAPETIIGASSPIGGQGEDLGETAEAKEKNALKATIDSLMTDRPPEAVALAKDMIETARAVSVDEALEVGLVDYKARNLDNLITQLDGQTLVVNNEEITLDLAEAEVESLDPSLIESLLQLLTDPNIVFILITLGVQALLIELYTPGGWVAGFIGVVSLALAIYGLGVLPVNLFGLIFLLTAFALFFLEIKTTTSGALTAAGVGSLIVGALVLFNSPGTPSFQRISIPLVVTVSLLTAGVFFGIVTFAVRSLRAPIQTGQESLVGQTGTVRSELNPSGSVHLHSEEWTAELENGEGTLPKGARVEVVRVEGIRLIVRPVAESS
jgi:membrane-bound serine protease (ClpP class)